ncbi:MAG: pentapeptide repeat-containing protein [Myxacorys chilensis ATA2-1-KO14]|jgi:uncharacterized protein YjbI with pentapeptide repeats|nr:pentapeptide repeat-containing protein [Myxacorys chilensis ATA2-1-KO14]
MSEPSPKKSPSFTYEQVCIKGYELWKNGKDHSFEAAVKAVEAEKHDSNCFRRFWRWTGFGEKKGWDFLQLLIVPLVLLGAAWKFQQVAKDQDTQSADNRAKQETLEKYFDQMTQLLKDKLRQAKTDSDEFILAQARTTTALRDLNTERQNLLFQFLRAADLLNHVPDAELKKEKPDEKERGGLLEKSNLDSTNLSKTEISKIRLNKASLKNVNLSEANLSEAYLSDADLTKANLSKANLKGAILFQTNFSNANLSGADLSKANLNRAILSGAQITERELSQAKLCDTRLPSNITIDHDRDCKELAPKK